MKSMSLGITTIQDARLSTESKRLPEGAVPFNDLVAIAAFRYALGRKTHIVGEIASFLRVHAELLEKCSVKLIVAEIDEAIERQGLGHDCDVVQWIAVREVMLSRLASRTAV